MRSNDPPDDTEHSGNDASGVGSHRSRARLLNKRNVLRILALLLLVGLLSSYAVGLW